MTRTNRASVQASRSWGRLIIVALGALLCLGVALHAHAQTAEADPPDRVARLSDLNGQVWLFAPETNEWVTVDRNRPLTTGDRIATDNDARAEVTLGSTSLRLDSATELEIVQLDDSRYLVHLHSGSVAARLRNAQSVAEFVLETDEGSFRAQTVGRYRFDHFEQASDLTVYNGQAIFEGRNSALPLTTGQHAQFWLDAGGAPQYNMVEPAHDAFASWNDDRDRTVDRPVATRYVSPEMTGAEDLDRYGAWEQTPDYGPVWTPRNVAVGWAPYSSGHWAWVRPWGWTWVDDAPWGFAPFHYGRWVNRRDVWSWSPGTYVARPVYAPALVAWMGGPRASVSVTIGGGGPPVGWFPLAPREVYVPSYRTSPRYVREVNITNVTNVTSITAIVNNTNGAADRRDFANRRFPNAVTIVPASVLTSRQQVGPAAAQFRGNPQFRALIADPRPGPVMTAAPVATPPAPAKAPEARAAIRPPFEGRAPGVFAGRPTPGSPPVAGGPPRGTPPTGAGPGRPVMSPPAGQPVQAVPTPGGARPDANRPDVPRPELARPGQVVRPNPTAIERPAFRGGVGREPGPEAPGLRPGMPPVQRAPQAVEPIRPGGAAPAVTPAPAAIATPSVGAAPATQDRERPPRRGGPEETRAPGRPTPVAPPAVNVAPPVNAAPPARAVEPPRNLERPRPPPRNIEAPRAVEAPRNVAPTTRAPEPPRAVAPVAAPVAPAAVAPVRPEPVRTAPEQRVGKPEAPRREDKRDDKRDPNERQR
ncbi:MAG: DUF6600 domain-containing protein [Caldimonas sp.]